MNPTLPWRLITLRGIGFLCLVFGAKLAIADSTPTLRFDGLYKSDSADRSPPLYLRFYPDNYVVDMAYSGTWENIGRSINRYLDFLPQGEYTLQGSSIAFRTKDAKGEVDYRGTLDATGISLRVQDISGGATQEHFSFLEVPFPTPPPGMVLTRPRVTMNTYSFNPPSPSGASGIHVLDRQAKSAFPDQTSEPNLRFDGVYQTDSGDHTPPLYLRFYEDHLVEQMGWSGAPEDVGRAMNESQRTVVPHGTYTLTGSTLTFTIETTKGEIDFSGSINGGALSFRIRYPGGDVSKEHYSFLEVAFPAFPKGMVITGNLIHVREMGTSPTPPPDPVLNAFNTPGTTFPSPSIGPRLITDAFNSPRMVGMVGTHTLSPRPAPIPMDISLIYRRVSWGPLGVESNSEMPVTIAGEWASTLGDYKDRQIQVINVTDLSGANISANHREVNVSASTTWRSLLQILDDAKLSVAEVPSDLDEKVGDSLAANRHGMNPRIGPLVNITKNISIFGPGGGRSLYVNRNEYTDLFRRIIGGFFSDAFIDQADLELTDNRPIERITSVMRAEDYPAYFTTHILRDPTREPAEPTTMGPSAPIILHEALLYAPDYNVIRTISWRPTDKPLTEQARLFRPNTRKRSWLTRVLAWCCRKLPGGGYFRRFVADPIFYRGDPVMTRNYVVSGGTDYLPDLDQAVHPDYTANEYFVPIDKFQAFRTEMAAILARNRISAPNVTIQFSPADTESRMSWAKTDVFIFRITYRDVADATLCSRELIDASAAAGGSFDLASQTRLATAAQILGAYPNTVDFLASKFLTDKAYVFHNALVDKFCTPEDYLIQFDWRSRSLAQWRGLERHVKDLRTQATKTGLYNIINIKSAEEIPELRRQLGELREANEKMLKSSQANLDEDAVASELRALKLSDEIASVFARSWHLDDEDTDLYVIKMRRIDEQFSNEVEAMFNLAERDWGHWRYYYLTNQLSFDDPAAVSTYNAILKAMAVARREEDKLTLELESNHTEVNWNP